MNFTTIKERFDAADSGRVRVTSFKRRHFKKHLSSIYGIGYQDLRKPSKDLVKKLISEGYDIEFQPINVLSEEDIEIELYIIKE